MPHDKAGNYLTMKEFMARWRKGIEGITPLQQTNTQLLSTAIMLVGIVAGIVISLFAIKNLWWLCLVLTGALGNTSVSYLGLWQKKQVLKRLYATDDVMECDIKEKRVGMSEAGTSFDKGLKSLAPVWSDEDVF